MTNLDCVRIGDFEQFGKQISNEYRHKKFDTFSSAADYIKRIDMSKLLNLPNFHRCLFHEDKHASASIFETKNGIFRYKCHTPNCKAHRTVDVIDVVRELQQSSFDTSVEFLMKSLDITYDYDDKNSFCKSCEDIIKGNRMFVDYCIENNSRAFKVIGANKSVLLALYNIAERQTFSKLKSQKLIIGASNTEIQAELTKEVKISRALAILAYFGLIRRVPNYEIATNRLETLIHTRNPNSCRIIGQTEIVRFAPDYSEAFAKLEQKADEWKVKGYKTKTFSFDEVKNRDSIFEANRLFPNK